MAPDTSSRPAESSPPNVERSRAKVAVTGANSSVGLNLLTHLADRHGTQVIACVRSERAASTLPDLPDVHPHVASYEDAPALARAMEGAGSVVHLAGILIEGKGQSYEVANVGTARAAATAAVAAGAEHLILVSVIGADPASANPYLRSKGESELAAAAAGIPCTVIRTPILMGPGTAGAAALIRSASAGRARLLGGGRYTMRPLDLDDLSRAVLSAIDRKPAGSETFEVVGPEPVAYRTLVSRAAEMLGREVSIQGTPIWLAKAGAFLARRVTGGGISPAVLDVITSDEVVEHNAAPDLGVELTPLAETLEKIIPPDQRAT